MSPRGDQRQGAILPGKRQEQREGGADHGDGCNRKPGEGGGQSWIEEGHGDEGELREDP
jgi:hypothetical protein